MRATCVSVGDLVGEVPSRGFEGLSFFVSLRGRGLITVGDGLFRFYSQEPVDGDPWYPVKTLTLLEETSAPVALLAILFEMIPVDF